VLWFSAYLHRRAVLRPHSYCSSLHITFFSYTLNLLSFKLWDGVKCQYGIRSKNWSINTECNSWLLYAVRGCSYAKAATSEKQLQHAAYCAVPIGCRHQNVTISFWFFFFRSNGPPVGQGLLIHEVSRSHSKTHHSRYDFSGRVINSRRDLYLTTHNTQNRQTSISLVGFEPTISAGEWL
jgi:hypothetical protein